MADDKPDVFFIQLPPDWERAREVLELKLNERRLVWDARNEALQRDLKEMHACIEKRFDELRTSHALTQAEQAAQAERLAVFEKEHTRILEEVTAVHTGVTELNNSFVNVSHQYSVLLSHTNADMREQSERWVAYDKEQKAIADNVKKGVGLLQREDAWRNAWRVAILITAWSTMIVLFVERIK